MNKMVLLCITSIIVQSGFARYPGIRTLKNKDAKTITIVNTTDKKIYVRLKPTYVHATCPSCKEHAATDKHIDDCCTEIKVVEYAVPAQTTQRILLDKIRVAMPVNEDEYLDFTKIVYAKIYDSKHKKYRYISIKDNTTYVISSIGKDIIIE